MAEEITLELGDGKQARFWDDFWVEDGRLMDSFPRLYSLSNQKENVVGECGFWDGLEWIWNFQWRRNLFQWELELLNEYIES